MATANRGLTLHPDRDVVLLNSDTEVNGDWLDRLARCAYADAHIGTVTPFSNNATICSYPDCGKMNELPPGLSLAETDALFHRTHAGRWLEIPTAVGFCMYLRRDCLQAVGLFDEQRFGLGYGEENDFCMRAAKAGWRHALCADTYVYHVGGVSFGARQAVLRDKAQAILRRLHPDYEQRIQEFLQNDPIEPLRRAVDRERVLLSSDQALCVLQERDEFLEGQRQTRATLEQAFQTAERLFHQTRDELRQRDRALAEAQRYVQDREADIASLTEQTQKLQNDMKERLTNLHAEMEVLRMQNFALQAQLDEIHASRVWRYTEFLRKS